MKTFGLSFLVAVGTLTAMACVALGFFTGGGMVFPAVVAWGAGSVFALARHPRHAWLHVAALGVLVAALINLYILAWPTLFAPPGRLMLGGPNQMPPSEMATPAPPD